VNTALPLLALSMGLISSLHCIGMCGPIALALPLARGNRWQQLGGLLLYNAGRAATYALLGMLAAGLGMSMAWFGFLRYLSIAAGVIMLAYVCWPSRLNTFLHPPRFWQNGVNAVKKGMGRALKKNSLAGAAMLGTLNGLIPCGLVYLALISSMATGDVAHGGMFMLLYGIGTFPAMLAVGFAKQWFTPALRTKARKLAPVMLAVAGLWLVVRGATVQAPSASRKPAHITICR
jgi:uncharacterized protein